MTSSNLPKRWIWTSIDSGLEDKALRFKYQRLSDLGLTGIFLGGGIDERELEIASQYNPEIHSWMWTTNRGEPQLRTEHPDWFMVSRSGKSCVDQPPYVDYYRWINPLAPGATHYICAKAKELDEHPLIKGVHLDYVRYPDVILPNSLWAQYGVDQTEELADYDFSYDAYTRQAFKTRFGVDPIELDRPDLNQDWLKFRFDTISGLVSAIRQTVSKPLTAAVFPTPSLARSICRQDWDKWLLTAACPMVYHNFYNESVEWIGDSVKENIQAVQFPVIAGLYLPAFQSIADFREGLSIAKHRGAYGASLFGDATDEHLSVLAEIFD